MSWSYRRSILNVVLDEDMRAHLKRNYGAESKVIRVWPSQELRIPEAVQNAERWTWLYSGNLGRAHDWRTLLDAQCLIEDRGLPIHLVFQGRGSVRAAAEAYSAQLNLRRVHWQDYASEEDLVASLLSANVLVATQREQAGGLLWPSKLALLLLLPRPLLFVGPPGGAIASDVGAASAQNAVFASGDHVALADWLQQQFDGSPRLDWTSEQALSLQAAITQSHDKGCSKFAQWLLAAVR